MLKVAVLSIAGHGGLPCEEPVKEAEPQGATRSRDRQHVPATATPQSRGRRRAQNWACHTTVGCAICHPIAKDLLTRVDQFVDILEAFVGMIGTSVARMDEQVAKAEAKLGTLPSTFR